MAEAPQSGTFGRSVKRVEDRALVTGCGRFLDDLRPDGCLAAAFLRSPYAHAAYTRVDYEVASGMPGVRAVFTLDDLMPVLTGRKLVVGLPSAAIELQVDRPILADGEVVHVGEAICMIVADTRAEAEDAAEAIEINFEPLAVIADCRDALASGAPTAHRDLPHNRLARFSFEYGDVDEAFSSAAHTVSESYEVHRGGSHSIEGRGVLAAIDKLRGTLDVWSSTQTPVALKKFLCDMLGREEGSVNVETPDLGGGFGPKLVTYPEEIAVAAASLILGRPVKWVEDRREHFVSTAQERDQVWDVAMALDMEGRALGIKGSLLHDHGAYTVRGTNVAYGAGVSMPLAYNVDAYRLDVCLVLTNKVPTSSIRGAGQPQAAFVMERLLDKAAAEMGMDRAEIRRRNLVRPDQMPCVKPLKLRGGTNIVLDSGDYPATMARALAESGWSDFEARRTKAQEAGLLRGIGMANYVEGTGRGPYESVRVKVNNRGRIEVTTGAAAMGQGTQTMLSQIVAEHLGGDISLISVKTGDTTNLLGFGGFNSRQTVTAGASAEAAALKVRSLLLKLASHMLEADEDDLDVLPGKVAVKGADGVSVSFARLASAAVGLAGFPIPALEKPGIMATEQVMINDMAYSNGSAVAEVEVDPETGGARVVAFTLAHDCGRMVNPALVDGQIIGGIAHGLGNSLFEKMLFDAEAQPLTTTFADYLLVSASEMPPVTILHTESPSPLNPLGVKGVGESGVIPAAPAIISAIDDAWRHVGLHLTHAPVSPQSLADALLERSTTEAA